MAEAEGAEEMEVAMVEAVAAARAVVAMVAGSGVWMVAAVMVVVPAEARVVWAEGVMVVEARVAAAMAAVRVGVAMGEVTGVE